MTIAFQNHFRPAPTPVLRPPLDYRIFREQLEQIDRLLIATGIEHRLINEKVQRQNQRRVFLRPLDFFVMCFYQFNIGSI